MRHCRQTMFFCKIDINNQGLKLIRLVTALCKCSNIRDREKCEDHSYVVVIYLSTKMARKTGVPFQKGVPI